MGHYVWGAGGGHPHSLTYHLPWVAWVGRSILLPRLIVGPQRMSQDVTNIQNTAYSIRKRTETKA